MPYKLPMRYTWAAERLGQFVRQHGMMVAAELKRRMAVVLEEGEEAPDIEHFMDVLARMVTHESAALEAADAVRDSEGGNIKWLLRQRAEADAETRAIVIAIRDRMRGTYGAKEANELLKVQGRTPLSPIDLERMADHLVHWLDGLELPPVAGCRDDPSAWARQLRPAWRRLRGVLDELEERRHLKSSGVDAKRMALKASARIYSRVVRLLELIYQLAGQGRWAKNLRHEFGPLRDRGPAGRLELDPQAETDRRDGLIRWLGGFSAPASKWLKKRRGSA